MSKTSELEDSFELQEGAENQPDSRAQHRLAGANIFSAYALEETSSFCERADYLADGSDQKEQKDFTGEGTHYCSPTFN